MKKIIFGILGTGSIAQKFVAATAVVQDEMELKAVGSRTKERAEEFASTHGISKAHGSYVDLAADPEIDVVYIATPHNLHLDNIRLCAEHGKHILCEKPLVLNENQALEAISIARKYNVFLMEAYWSVFVPAFGKFKELLHSGQLGKVDFMRAEIGFSHPGKRGFRKVDRALAGGAMLDIGVYNVMIASEVFGYDGQVLEARAAMNEYGTDIHDEFILTYSGGQAAYLMDTVRGRMDNKAIVYGEKGCLILHNYLGSQKVTLDVNGEPPMDFEFPFKANGYEYEIQHVCQCIRQGKNESEIMPLSKSIAILRISDTIRSKINLKYDMEG
jgi:predicted dehydrogenase